MLFGVQSPSVAPVELLQHIEQFLNRLPELINALDDTTFNAQRQALADQFCSAALTTAQAAELLWQSKLAGRSSDYLTHLPEAIVHIDRTGLLAAAQRLNQAEGGWLCLANSITPGAPWQAAK
jgi:secreted Zn-dependent insulinase-like peptidase